MSGSRRKGPENEETPTKEVNFSYRFINLSNVMGAGDWERKNRSEESSSIIDIGFNGWGLCIFSCLSKYVEYLVSFYPHGKLFKKKDGD